MEAIKRGRGRPPATSAEDLQEAAYELFMTHGYEATNASMITNAIGTSRSTFFNYYRVKTDIFWLQTDSAIENFIGILQTEAAELPTHEAITHAAVTATASWGASEVPWIFHNFELIGSPTAALESAAPRVAQLQQAISISIKERSPELNAHTLATRSSIYTAAIVGACLAWAATTADRGNLSDHIGTALEPLEQIFPDN